MVPQILGKTYTNESRFVCLHARGSGDGGSPLKPRACTLASYYNPYTADMCVNEIEVMIVGV